MMTREEALRELMDIRDEATAYPDSVCYVTSEDEDALNVAIEALTLQNLSKPNNTCEVDIISRADAIAAVESAKPKDKEYHHYKHIAVDAISALPSAETRPTGKWIIEERESVFGTKYILTCSVCGESVSVTESALPYEKYCRTCGADMRGKEE